MKRFIFSVVLVSLFGCGVTVTGNKSLTIPASSKPVTVEAKAKTICKDYFFVYKCNLYLDLESSDGQKK